MGSSIREAEISHKLFFDGLFNSSLFDATLKVTCQLYGLYLKINELAYAYVPPQLKRRQNSSDKKKCQSVRG
jgi:hypothetical protein